MHKLNGPYVLQANMLGNVYACTQEFDYIFINIMFEGVLHFVYSVNLHFTLIYCGILHG